MRSTAGTVAALFLIGLVANCGGDDTNNSGPKGGSANASGEGGEGNNTSGTSTGGTSTAGKTGSMGGEGGTPVAVECSKDADCGAAAKCIDNACKKDDGEACTADIDCQNSCVDDVCSSKSPDGTDCTSDDECAHTCIDGVCAPVSPVGGDCDVELGAGGAGAGGAGSGGAAGAAGAGGEAALPQARDCEAPLQCVSGKCLTPDGEACTDNVDCVNTCVANVCEPVAGVDGACDDKSDCVNDNLVCDLNKKKCKLDVLSQCQTNTQCQSNRCLCSDPTCSVRVCKTDDSVCQCRYSPTDSPSCNNSSPVLNIKTKDPNGCDGAQICSNGNCIADAGGACTEPCTFKPGNPDAMPAVPDSCVSAGAPTGCNGGYHGNVTSQCAVVKGTQTCTATCQCDLN